MLTEIIGILSRHKSYMALFVAAAAATFLLTPLYIAFAKRMGWVDSPGGRKQHAQPTPTMGGLAIFAVVFAGIAVALSLNNRVAEMLEPHRRAILTAILCTAVMMGVGVIDDLRRLPARSKLLVQLVVAMAAYLLGYGVSAVTIPWIGSVAIPLGRLFAPLLSIIWIVGITNAVNLTDGLDGLAVGIGFLAAATNAVVAIALQNYYMAVMMIVLAGALLGFLRWNFHPARVFLGDTGSLGLGMFLALCSLHSAQKSHTVVMILVPLCALGYPIFDTLIAVARRSIMGQPLLSGDRDHVHHRLASRGYGASGAALRIYAASLALIVICVLLSSVNHLVVGLGLLLALALVIFCVRVLGYLEWAGWTDMVRGRDETRLLHAAAELSRLKIAAATNLPELLEGLGVFASEIGATALEAHHAGETHRWARHGAPRSEAASSSAFSIGPSAGLLELPVGVTLDPRALIRWDDLCRLAGDRLESWTIAQRPAGAAR